MSAGAGLAQVFEGLARPHLAKLRVFIDFFQKANRRV
jgi:hypothetical protein